MPSEWDQFKPVAAPADEWDKFKKAPGVAPVEPEDTRSWYQKLGTGAVHGLNLASKGLTDTAQALTPEFVQKPFRALNQYATSKGFPLTPTDETIAQGAAATEKAGGWGTTGKFLGQMAPEALTAPLAEAKLAVGAGKALPAALQYLAKPAAQIGANAATAATFAPEDKLGAAEGGAAGTVLGSALAKGVGKGYEYGKRAVGRAVEEVSPGSAATSARALRAIERTVGKSELERATGQLESPIPTMLPQTTAAASGSNQLGAMERGARGRGGADFGAHDRAVDAASWSFLKGATPEADQLAGLQGQHTKLFNEGQKILDKLPFSKANRADVSKQLLDLRNSNLVTGDATGQSARAINTALEAIDNPNASLGVLAQLHSSLDGSNPGTARVKDVLKEMLDKRSKGEFTNTLEGYKATADAIQAAERSAALRGKFMGPDNVPVTPRYSGESGTATAVPGIDSGPLRRAMAPNDPSNIELNKLSDALRSHEIYKSPGATGIKVGKAEDLATAGINTGPFWRLRGTIKAAFGPLNDKTAQAVDEALLNPQKFLELVDARRAKQAALQPWEAKLEKIIRSGGQGGARIGSQTGQGE